jgi:hypothetical protein
VGVGVTCAGGFVGFGAARAVARGVALGVGSAVTPGVGSALGGIDVNASLVPGVEMSSLPGASIEAESYDSEGGGALVAAADE